MSKNHVATQAIAQGHRPFKIDPVADVHRANSGAIEGLLADIGVPPRTVGVGPLVDQSEAATVDGN